MQNFWKNRIFSLLFYCIITKHMHGILGRCTWLVRSWNIRATLRLNNTSMICWVWVWVLVPKNDQYSWSSICFFFENINYLCEIVTWKTESYNLFPLVISTFVIADHGTEKWKVSGSTYVVLNFFQYQQQ